ncbi:hypothetical protein MCSV2_20169 [Mucispirillum schaedleri ASF457]|nr:hypothetical protein MCSV2_20169 [Mucispirillum schaedleri ASF457]
MKASQDMLTQFILRREACEIQFYLISFLYHNILLTNQTASISVCIDLAHIFIFISLSG